MEENEVMSIDEMLDETMRESFIKLNEYEIGSAERERAHKELMANLEIYLKNQKAIQEANEAALKLEESNKNAKKDRRAGIAKVIIESVVKGAAVAGSTLLSLKLYGFAQKGGFMTRDESQSVGLLQRIIDRIA